MNSTNRADWTLLAHKFLTDEEVRRLRIVSAQRTSSARPSRDGGYRGRRNGQRRACLRANTHRQAVRDGLIINLALFTGLRVQEIADLKCGDIMIKEDTAFIIVQCGKGDKSRLVHFNGELSRHLKAYLEWKVTQGERDSTG